MFKASEKLYFFGTQEHIFRY